MVGWGWGVGGWKEWEGRVWLNKLHRCILSDNHFISSRLVRLIDWINQSTNQSINKIIRKQTGVHYYCYCFLPGCNFKGRHWFFELCIYLQFRTTVVQKQIIAYIPTHTRYHIIYCICLISWLTMDLWPRWQQYARILHTFAILE